MFTRILTAQENWHLCVLTLNEQCVHLASTGRPSFSTLDSQHASTISHQVEQSLWQKIGTIDELNQSTQTLQTTLFGWRQLSELHPWIISERFLCWRHAGFHINSSWGVKDCQDAQEAHSRVSQQSRITNNSFRRRFSNGMWNCVLETFSRSDATGNFTRPRAKRQSLSHSNDHMPRLTTFHATFHRVYSPPAFFSLSKTKKSFV